MHAASATARVTSGRAATSVPGGAPVRSGRPRTCNPDRSPAGSATQEARRGFLRYAFRAGRGLGVAAHGAADHAGEDQAQAAGTHTSRASTLTALVSWTMTAPLSAERCKEW